MPGILQQPLFAFSKYIADTCSDQRENKRINRDSGNRRPGFHTLHGRDTLPTTARPAPTSGCCHRRFQTEQATFHKAEKSCDMPVACIICRAAFTVQPCHAGDGFAFYNRYLPFYNGAQRKRRFT
jgi:hypothetical protein